LVEYSRAKLKELFENFLRSFKDGSGRLRYRIRLAEAVERNLSSVVINFNDLACSDSSLALYTIKNPEFILPIFTEAALEVLTTENPFYSEKVKDMFRVRIKDLPERVSLRSLKVELGGQLVSVQGIAVRTSELVSRILVAAFVCPKGHQTFVKQETEQLTLPSSCSGCDERRNFKLDVSASTFTDVQYLRLQELPEEMPSGQLPRYIEVEVDGDIVDVARPGDRVTVTGVLSVVRSTQVMQRAGTTYRLRLKGLYVEVLGKEPEELKPDPEEERKFKELAKREDWYQTLISSIAPSIYGMDHIKEAIMLLIVGSPERVMPDKTRIRGNLNMLLAGDPGTAKSELLKYASRLAPRGLYTSGKGTSAAGLTAAVVKEKTGVLMLEAGALVLADQAVCAIDEFDKMRPEDRQALHEAMEQQTVSIAKGGIIATLNARTSILAAANPMLGRYDVYRTLFENVNLPVPLLSRFDLIFVVRDVPDRSADEQMALHILEMHRGGEPPTRPPLDMETLRKYFYYASKINPRLSLEAEKAILDVYLELRSTMREASIPITPRQLESLIRLSTARARALLKDEVTLEDALQAIALFKTMLHTSMCDVKTGKPDLGVVYGIPGSQRGAYGRVMEIFRKLSGKEGNPVDGRVLIRELVEIEGITEEEARRVLQNLIRTGIIYEYKPGLYKRVAQA